MTEGFPVGCRDIAHRIPVVDILLIEPSPYLGGSEARKSCVTTDIVQFVACETMQQWRIGNQAVSRAEAMVRALLSDGGRNRRPNFDPLGKGGREITPFDPLKNQEGYEHDDSGEAKHSERRVVW